MTNLISEAFMVMVTGMITVFVFLTLLIGAMGLLRIIAGKVEVESQTQSSGEQQPSAMQLAAISAAIHQYRRQRRS
ncbi:OadG family protein [Pseudidiomarina marina]|uniref:Oxaloacetate decarboxylase gamma chain n=1 Tax=Pseudidiomarina marina TaxID=502366 RepID=A0A432YIK0_9GAMM|nr:OadG family protein [Pseudidiomarina marina]MBL4741542.1 OadG family protein [Idiomarina sp.]PHQ77844.1 MAG: hypothetical protein COB75_01205 [Idiomarina sp.]PHR66049.1 MAG: hypothetical protein COA51_03260 [Idiomarina sp.]RUO60801.1 hypothetical protein CWI76_00520 [Pseudidiomarina marina]